MKLHEYIVEDKAEHLLGQFGTKIEQAAKKDHFAHDYVDKAASPISIIKYLQNQVGNKYLQWAVRQYASGDFKLEDVSRVKQALKQFQQKQRALPIKDLNQYRSIADLEDAVEEAQPEQSKRQQKQEIKTEGADVVVKGSDGVVLELKTKEAACYYGKGTKWCTAANSNNMFDNYNQAGPLHVFIGNDGRKFQFHFESRQFMDERDDSVDVMKLRSKYPTVDVFFKKHESELVKTASAEDLYYYTYYIMEGKRWPEAEPVIAKNPDWAFWYAKDVLKGKRWPEAEPYIMKEPRLAFWYAKDVLKGKRWPEAEPVIMKDPRWAFWYAKEVIEYRWPEAEPVIMKDPELGLLYKQHFNI